MKIKSSPTKVCEWCKVEFVTIDKRQRFCSRSHAASFNNAVYPKRIAAVRVKKIRKTSLQKWLDGEWNGTTKQGLSSPIRKYLISLAGNKCQDGRSGCGGWGLVNEKSGRICLTVDHVDGDATNNSIENLVVMCPNCHSMTPTYGALNKGSGRKTRYATFV